ncbi:hypothetical protein BS47DRAFT_1359858 [Hydnum rufescens UP504]|uniref:Uncharacterized protein n=1 Tax=Hydnum rufescens UP504 TaxID=1448309 RepID=A0A9P6B484_9AGAM|nr:hypothetical protein BS47DRAFT_1359858 [Hydnum rufescens UP504]
MPYWTLTDFLGLLYFFGQILIVYYLFYIHLLATNSYGTHGIRHLSTFWILAIPGVELHSFLQLVTTTQQGSHPDKTQPHTCCCRHVVTRHGDNSPNEAPNGNRTDGNTRRHDRWQRTKWQCAKRQCYRLTYNQQNEENNEWNGHWPHEDPPYEPRAPRNDGPPHEYTPDGNPRAKGYTANEHRAEPTSGPTNHTPAAAAPRPQTRDPKPHDPKPAKRRPTEPNPTNETAEWGPPSGTPANNGHMNHTCSSGPEADPNPVQPPSPNLVSDNPANETPASDDPTNETLVDTVAQKEQPCLLFLCY